MNSKILSVLALGALVACAPKNPDLGKQPEGDVGAMNASKAISVAPSLKPKVDILFVIDTSDSMVQHQERLKSNIDRFVEAFKEHSNVDYHIGAVSVWDSKRFDKGGIAAPYPFGKLRPIKDANGQVMADLSFVSSERFPNIADATAVLGQSLKIGVEPRFKSTTDEKGNIKYEYARDASGNVLKDDRKRPVKIDGGGPEDEELFVQIEPALLTNPGFYRQDAHLAVIMITDTDDASKNQADEMAKLLRAMKKGDTKLVSAHAALSLSASCPKDPGLVEAGGDPKKIKSLVGELGGKVMDLCDERYGDKLAEVGRAIRQKASSLVTISLQTAPERPTLKVTYNGVAIDGDNGRAWSYDEVYNSIVIHGDHQSFAKNPGGTLDVTFVPLDLERAGRGHFRRVQ